MNWPFSTSNTPSQHPGHRELAARMESYELAYRMQMEVPDVIDLEGEPEHIREMYGLERSRDRCVSDANA